MSVEDKLAKLGITGKAYKLYIAAVGLGRAPLQEVAERAGLRRTTAYDVLDRLEVDGLVTVSEQDGRRWVTAEDPVVLLQSIERRREVVADVLPQLRSLWNLSKGKPQIHFYEGIEGVRTVLADTLTCQSKQLRGILSMNELLQTPGLEEINRNMNERLERGIMLHVIRSRSRDVLEKVWTSSEREMRKLRYAPDGMVLSMTQYIYDNKVAMISSSKEDYGLIIESEEFAKMQNTLFEMLWAASIPTPDYD